MSRRGSTLWKVRGTTARRVVTRVVPCQHCGGYYDVARDFDRHYKGACVAAPKPDASSAPKETA